MVTNRRQLPGNEVLGQPVVVTNDPFKPWPVCGPIVFGDLEHFKKKRYILTGDFTRTHVDAIQIGQPFNFGDEDGPDESWQVTKILPTPDGALVAFEGTDKSGRTMAFELRNHAPAGG